MRTRRRRTYGNPTLGASGPTSTEVNEATSAREDSWNQQAAASYAASRQPTRADYETELMTGAQEDPTAGQDQIQATNQARAALARALGYDPRTAPPLHQLMAQYYSKSPQVQAGIYRQGGAQFLDGKSGVKLLQSAAEEKEKMLDAHTNELGSHLATGKVNYDLNPDGTPSFFALQDDETDPTGMKKKKVPLNKLQLALLDRGFKKGTIPNPFAPPPAPEAVDKTPRTTDDMMRVLNARQRQPISASEWGGLSEEGQKTFAQFDPGANRDLSGYKLPPDRIAMPTVGPTGAANMSLSPYNYNSPMQFREPVGEQYGPPLPDDFGLTSGQRAHRAVGNALTAASESTVVGDALDAVGQTYFSDLPRAVGMGADWLGSFFSGEAPPEDSFRTTVVPAKLSPMDAALQAAQFRQRQAEEKARRDAEMSPPLELIDRPMPMNSMY